MQRAWQCFPHLNIPLGQSWLILGLVNFEFVQSEGQMLCTYQTDIICLRHPHVDLLKLLPILPVGENRVLAGKNRVLVGKNRSCKNHDCF